MSIGAISSTRRHVLFKYLGVLSSTIASLAWLATIVALFALWAVDDFVRYARDDGEVAYISNVGARHKTVFIIGTAITGTFFVFTLIFTKISFDMENQRRLKRGVSIASIIFGIIASISLLLLAVLDSINYQAAHYTFTGFFIICTLISAILTIVHRYSHDQVNLTIYIRVLFVSMVIPSIITFVVMTTIRQPNDQTQLRSVAASIEWAIAILFIVYLALFALDLLLYD